MESIVRSHFKKSSITISVEHDNHEERIKA